MNRYEYGIYVSVLNPLFIKQSGGGSIRKVKTDKADAMKIAKYGLDNWTQLREYTPMTNIDLIAEIIEVAAIAAFFVMAVIWEVWHRKSAAWAIALCVTGGLLVWLIMK